jgi:hypothetical protein
VGDATSGDSTRRVVRLGRRGKNLAAAWHQHSAARGVGWSRRNELRGHRGYREAALGRLAGARRPGSRLLPVSVLIWFAGLFRPAELGVCKEAIRNSVMKDIYLICKKAGLGKRFFVRCLRWVVKNRPRAFDANCRWRFVRAYSADVRIGGPRRFGEQ